jgi:hypothetical protein
VKEEDVGLHGRIIINLLFKKWDMRPLAGSIWFRIGTGGGLL